MLPSRSSTTPAGEPPSVATWTASATSRPDVDAVSVVVEETCTATVRDGDVEVACVVPEGTYVAV